ncbi:MAG: toxin-antitoxin system HicB family antitoxin [Betaproteobacteria bacterium]|nr:toxin-antitoxin system HicB family antitoxin [Betaproteobacteria bacterium]
MTALTVRLPNSVNQKVKALAQRDDISVNQFIAAAVSEKMASVMTLDYLKSEAAKGNRSDFDRFMHAIPNAPVGAGDELPKL